MNHVLVTGADGFIGSHLAEQLVQQGYKVRALAQYNSMNSWGWLDRSEHSDDMEIITGDIRDPSFCNDLVKGCDTVFHLAALIAIPYSYQAPTSYVDTNVLGTINILNAARHYEVDRLIHTSTSEVYGTALYVPIDEKHPLQPQSPYSASKIAADAMVQSYIHSYEMPATLVRPFNTYGPRQSARAVIPTMISQIASGQSKIALGDLTPTRDFNFVLDTCKGFILAARSDQALGQTINIGSDSEISIGDLVKLIAKLMDRDVEVSTDPARMRPKNSEVHRLWCDPHKARQMLDYAPSFDLEQGLKQTIAWFQDEDNLKNYKTHIYNV